MFEIRCPKCNSILVEENVKEGEVRGYCRKCKVYVHKVVERVIVPQAAVDRKARKLDNETVYK